MGSDAVWFALVDESGEGHVEEEPFEVPAGQKLLEHLSRRVETKEGSRFCGVHCREVN